MGECGLARERIRPDFSFRSRDWAIFTSHLDAFFNNLPSHSASENGVTNGVEKDDDPASEIRDFLHNLCQIDMDNSPTERGSRLAVLELEKRIRRHETLKKIKCEFRGLRRGSELIAGQHPTTSSS